MGQQLSAHQDDATCFRACLRDKKNKTHKSPAGPIHYPPHRLTPDRRKIPQQRADTPLPLKPELPQLREGQTSLDLRWQTETRPYTEVNGRVYEQQKQTVVKQNVDNNQQQVAALGLQSKFSSSYKSRTKVLIKNSKASQGGNTRCISQKEVGNSHETSTKSQQNTSSNTRSRKILQNKIEDIKQKYYQRQLEIEIYQDENEYQQQLNQLAKIQEKCLSPHNQLPLASAKEITSLKKKILEKLSQRKMMRNRKSLEKNTREDMAQTDAREDEEAEKPSSHDELELYSRQNERQTQQELGEPKKEQQEIKSSTNFPRRQKLNKSTRSIDLSQDINVEQRVQFSIDSQPDTLQQIRQCDQQQQDYKSKVQSKIKPTFRAIHSKRFTNPQSNVNTIKQTSQVLIEKNDQTNRFNQGREAQLVSKHSSRVIRVSSSGRSIRGVSEQRADNKILFF